MPGGWIAISVLAVLLTAALFGTYEGWTAHSGDIQVPQWGLALLAVGIVFGLLIGGGLMALIFYSNRTGYDQPVVVQQHEDADAKGS